MSSDMKRFTQVPLIEFNSKRWGPYYVINIRYDYEDVQQMILTEMDLINLRNFTNIILPVKEQWSTD